MLSKKQLSEIREHLEKAQNPIFLFDNDVDGLCSYVLLRRFTMKGKGVAVKSHPIIDVGYAKRVQELNGDYVFVLDRHSLGESFVSEIAGLNLPIIWIDHHDVPIEKHSYENLFYYNPIHSKNKSAESTTHLCYSATNREEDYWIALIGCIADHYLPEDFSKFSDLYPELWGKKITEPFQALYTTGIGRVARALSFGLKDSISHVVQLQNLFISSKGPHELEKELEGKSAFALKYKEVLEKYQTLLGDAKKSHYGEKLVFFNYGGNLSISSDLSNELSYLYPDKYVCVSYTLGPNTNVSLRGEGVGKILEKLLPEFQDARGGGHANAVGARIKTEDVERFKQRIMETIK